MCLTLVVGSWLLLYAVTMALSYPLSAMTGRSPVEGESESCYSTSIHVYRNTCFLRGKVQSLPCTYHILGNICSRIVLASCEILHSLAFGMTHDPVMKIFYNKNFLVYSEVV